MVKKPALIPIIGLSHNTERGGELVLSFYFKIGGQNESNMLRHKFIMETSKRKPPIQNH